MITEQTVKEAFTISRVFADPAFLNMFEDHIPYILRTQKYITRTITPVQALRYTGDFNGLMLDLNVAENLRYPSMRLCGFNSSTSYDGTLREIRLVDGTYYNQLARVFSGSTKK